MKSYMRLITESCTATKENEEETNGDPKPLTDGPDGVSPQTIIKTDRQSRSVPRTS